MKLNLDKNLNKNELNYAFRLWVHKNFKYRLEDQILEPYLSLDIKSHPKSWLKIARLGLQRSTPSVAQRMNISATTYASYELSEENRTIQMSTLMAAAEAIDCELIYVTQLKKLMLSLTS